MRHELFFPGQLFFHGKRIVRVDETDVGGIGFPVAFLAFRQFRVEVGTGERTIGQIQAHRLPVIEKREIRPIDGNRQESVLRRLSFHLKSPAGNNGAVDGHQADPVHDIGGRAVGRGAASRHDILRPVGGTGKRSQRGKRQQNTRCKCHD